MKHDNFASLWANPCLGGKGFNTTRDLRFIVASLPQRQIFETGETIITNNYYRDTARGDWHGTHVGICTPDEAPQLRTLDGTPVPTAWLNEATDDAQMLLLDYDHRVAIRLAQRLDSKGYRTGGGFAYYPTKGSLPVPNAPIILSRPDRKAALRASKRLKVLQGVANFRVKASSEHAKYHYAQVRVDAWMQICMGGEDLHTALAGADMNDVHAILRITPKDINTACRIVTEHTYLKF